MLQQLATAVQLQPTTVEGTTEITITGTNFGSSTDEIQVFATTKVPVAVSGVVPLSGRRRKRSVVEENDDEDNEDNSPELHKWWYQKSVTFGTDKKPKFR